MGLFDLFRNKKKPEPPPERPRQPYIPGYSYLQYRVDLLNSGFTIDDIFDRCDGRIPRKPRYPKAGEVWEFHDCTRHGTKDLMYPSELKFDPAKDYWPFIHCGCLYFLYDGKNMGDR